ncbi:MAG: hypothetical protein LBM27_05195 [Lactobacillaceae bacterium]|nr:hypothetical protein [Lactobacillaceae bacterium]
MKNNEEFYETVNQIRKDLRISSEGLADIGISKPAYYRFISGKNKGGLKASVVMDLIFYLGLPTKFFDYANVVSEFQEQIYSYVSKKIDGHSLERWLHVFNSTFPKTDSYFSKIANLSISALLHPKVVNTVSIVDTGNQLLGQDFYSINDYFLFYSIQNHLPSTERFQIYSQMWAFLNSSPFEDSADVTVAYIFQETTFQIIESALLLEDVECINSVLSSAFSIPMSNVFFENSILWNFLNHINDIAFQEELIKDVRKIGDLGLLKSQHQLISILEKIHSMNGLSPQKTPPFSIASNKPKTLAEILKRTIKFKQVKLQNLADEELSLSTLKRILHANTEPSFLNLRGLMTQLGLTEGDIVNEFNNPYKKQNKLALAVDANDPFAPHIKKLEELEESIKSRDLINGNLYIMGPIVQILFLNGRLEKKHLDFALSVAKSYPKVKNATSVQMWTLRQIDNVPFFDIANFIREIMKEPFPRYRYFYGLHHQEGVYYSTLLSLAQKRTSKSDNKIYVSLKQGLNKIGTLTAPHLTIDIFSSKLLELIEHSEINEARKLALLFEKVLNKPQFNLEFQNLISSTNEFQNDIS